MPRHSDAPSAATVPKNLTTNTRSANRPAAQGQGGRAPGRYCLCGHCIADEGERYAYVPCINKTPQQPTNAQALQRSPRITFPLRKAITMGTPPPAASGAVSCTAAAPASARLQLMASWAPNACSGSHGVCFKRSVRYC